ncbi:MAG TPA: hypothetical protein VKU60_13425, partial [Chloroflexota bacterium]|nr:hypothetical protein [Chloroflexota bacterium]
MGRPQVITIQASDYAFQMPPTIVSGLVTFQVKNSGQEPHNFSLLKLKDGVAVEQGMAAATKGDRRSLAAETVSSGGVASISSEVSGETTVSLAPGNYLVVCQVAGADGVPHMMKGMAMPVQVTAPSAAASISPRTAGTLTLKDFAFDVPATLSKGNTYQVTNQGPQTHEMEVVKLDSGKTVSDLPAFFASDRSGRPPFQELGGAAAVGPGDSNSYWTIDVPP